MVNKSYIFTTQEPQYFVKYIMNDKTAVVEEIDRADSHESDSVYVITITIVMSMVVSNSNCLLF